jgi:type IV pilus assembly protein PilW
MRTSATTSPLTSSAGYSLVELLISMLLGLFLLTGAYQTSLTNKKANRLHKTLQETQKNGRFAIDNLSYAIKTAGYSGFYGTFSSGVENLLNTPVDQKWNISIPVSGFNNVNSSDTIAGITGFTPNTDVLLLKGMNSNSVPVISNTNPSTLVVATASAFSAGDLVVVSDVDQASVFQVNTVSSTTTTSSVTLAAGGSSPGNSALLSNSYNSDAEIGKYDVQMFYIKNGLNGAPALFKTAIVNSGGSIQFQEIELVSDIKNMQISYGIDNNNDQILDEYKDASTIADWSQLISINVVLLASSNNDNIVPEASSFSFDANLVTFVRDTVASAGADKRLKRVFRTYVPLRNSRS